MVKLNKQTSVTGVSVLEVDGKEEQVAYMSATISVNDAPNTSKVIQNVELFNANKDEILKDFAAFDEYIYSLFPIEQSGSEN